MSEKLKARLFIVEIYSCDCPKCGELFETGISRHDASIGDELVCPACETEFEVGEIDDL